LPESLVRDLGQLDLQRVVVCIEFVERWLACATSKGAPAHELFLLLQVLEQDGGWDRLRLETLLIEAVLPFTEAAGQELRRRLDGLRTQVSAAVASRSQPGTAAS
jgi:hypothetical protein